MSIDRDKLRETADRATPGPWEVSGSLIGIGRAKPDIGQTWGLRWRANIEFICAAREAVPTLLDALDRAEVDRDQAEARIQAAREVHRHGEIWTRGATTAEHRCSECMTTWPCATIRALDGKV